MTTLDERRLLIDRKQELLSLETQFNELKKEPSIETRASATMGQLFLIPNVLGIIGLIVAQMTCTDWRGAPIFSTPTFLLIFVGCLVLIVIGSNALTKSKNSVIAFEKTHKDLSANILELKKQIIELENPL